MKNTLEIDSVILAFGLKKVLQDVYLKCETGNVTGLLGRNGSGKSCLLNILFGELDALDKSIRINGNYLDTARILSHDIKYLPQNNFIPKKLTVARVFNDFGLSFDAFCALFPLYSSLQDQRIDSLSGGQVRIIEIYVILLSDAKFCLLDEPFSEVMPLHVDIIKQLIIKQKDKKGILITDHLYQHVLDISDNLYVIRNGKTHIARDKSDLEKLGYL
jgi:ABC-type multidrug transport system ATPase subunit